jgi:methylaspartate ammonia-lyase
MAAAGTSAAVGTGAFTSVSATRGVNVHVAEDADALLAIEPSPGPNGEYAVVGNGQIAIRLARLC